MDDYSESRIESIRRRIKRLKGRIEYYKKLKESLEEESESIRPDGILGLVWRPSSWAFDRRSIVISKKVERCERWLARLEFELEVLLSIEKITESGGSFDDK